VLGGTGAVFTKSRIGQIAKGKKKEVPQRRKGVIRSMERWGGEANHDGAGPSSLIEAIHGKKVGFSSRFKNSKGSSTTTGEI